VRRFTMVLAAVFVLVGCGQPEENLAIVASSPGTIGSTTEQRVLIGLVNPETSEFIASPDLAVKATFTGPDGQVIEVPTEFLWSVEGLRGLYVARVSFDTPGQWSVVLTPTGMGSTPAASLAVADKAVVPEVGESPPAVATRTTADHSLAEITTDPDPEPAFYELSLDDALSNGRPTVVVFATPAFCITQTCGPLLDQVQALSSDHPDVNFLHVEVYENLDATTFDELRTVPAVAAWGLPSEPWVFFIDAEGLVTARIEGSASDQEIEAALASIGG
jgi:hypothetical protein